MRVTYTPVCINNHDTNYMSHLNTKHTQQKEDNDLNFTETYECNVCNARIEIRTRVEQ